MVYTASDKRYDNMEYRRCGNSGLKLPIISLGLWQNFGGNKPFENSRVMLLRSFDLGITHFDIANNYGPPPGSAEEAFGKVLKKDLLPYRDELIVSTKAGYTMWPGPYGDWGSKKYMVASLDQSLKRMGLDYVDIFYHHRPDPNTPLEETMGALAQIVKQGKALYAGVSNYNAQQTKEASRIMKELGVPLLIHQPNYSMLNRWVEDELLDVLEKEGIGSIAFCPLGRGQLTNKYIQKVEDEFQSGQLTLKPEAVTENRLIHLHKLQQLAADRGQTISQLALSWLLRDGGATYALIGASRVEQIEENVAALKAGPLTQSELQEIDQIVIHIPNIPW